MAKIAFLMLYIIFNFMIFGEEKFRISVPESSKGLKVTEAVENILRGALKKEGYEAEFVYLPDERSIRKADSGEYDGEFSRIRNTIEGYENLVIVEEPTVTIRMYAYTINGNLKETNWEQLKNYRVISIFGNKLAERELKYKMKNGNFEQVKDYDTAFKMLERNRADYIIMEMVNDVREREKKYFREIEGLKRSEPYLVEEKMYFSVNKKYRNISEKIANRMRDIKKNR